MTVCVVAIVVEVVVAVTMVEVVVNVLNVTVGGIGVIVTLAVGFPARKVAVWAALHLVGFSVAKAIEGVDVLVAGEGGRFVSVFVIEGICVIDGIKAIVGVSVSGTGVGTVCPSGLARTWTTGETKISRITTIKMNNSFCRQL